MNILINIAEILAVATAVLTFWSRRWTPAVAMAGLLLAYFAGAPIGVEALIFWLVALVIVLALNYMLPAAVSTTGRGVGYIAGGTLAGLFVGVLISPSWLVLGGIIGAIFGGIAYALTPAGKVLRFPSSVFLNYLCAKGLPAVVNLTVAALIVNAALIALNVWQ